MSVTHYIYFFSERGLASAYIVVIAPVSFFYFALASFDDLSEFNSQKRRRAKGAKGVKGSKGGQSKEGGAKGQRGAKGAKVIVY